MREGLLLIARSYIFGTYRCSHLPTFICRRYNYHSSYSPFTNVVTRSSFTRSREEEAEAIIIIINIEPLLDRRNGVYSTSKDLTWSLPSI